VVGRLCPRYPVRPVRLRPRCLDLTGGSTFSTFPPGTSVAYVLFSTNGRGVLCDDGESFMLLRPDQVAPGSQQLQPPRPIGPSAHSNIYTTGKMRSPA
jgi:hypothetical protein